MRAQGFGLQMLLCAGAMGAPPTFTACVVERPEGFGFAAGSHLTDGGLAVGRASPLEGEYPIRAAISDACGRATLLAEGPQIPDWAIGANDAGMVVGSSNFQAVAWVEGEVGVLDPTFETLDGEPAIGFSGSANAVTSGGLIAGHIDLGFGPEIQAVYWPSVESQGVLLDGIGDPLCYGAALDVNEAEMIVGVVMSAPGAAFSPAVWETPESEALVLDVPDGFSVGEAVAINGAGDAAGRFGGGSGSEPFLYRAVDGSVEMLGHLDGAATAFAEARDVGVDQTVVGSSNAGEGVAHAFLWRAGVMHDLNDLVGPIDGILYLDDAVSINASGQVLATGVIDDTPGFIEKTMVVLTPSCAADVNGDGELNVLDFVAFQGLFVAGDPAADCDGSGGLDVLDFVCFQGVFQAGCG